MKKTIITLFSLIICNLIFAQQFKPATISSGGGIMSNANAKLSFTIGEVVTGNIANASSKLTQGFQQNWIVSTGITENIKDNNILVYPNPASDIINIKFEKEIYAKAIIELLDINGKVLLMQNVADNKAEIQINLSNYSDDIYFIKVSSQHGKTSETFKIYKTK